MQRIRPYYRRCCQWWARANFRLDTIYNIFLHFGKHMGNWKGIWLLQNKTKLCINIFTESFKPVQLSKYEFGVKILLDFLSLALIFGSVINGISLASNTFGASPISPAIKLTVITPKMIDSKSEAFMVTVIYIMI